MVLNSYSRKEENFGNRKHGTNASFAIASADSTLYLLSSIAAAMTMSLSQKSRS